MSDIFLKAMWEAAEVVLLKPPGKREKDEIENILAWFRHRSPLFKTLEDDIMADIIKNVKFLRVRKDHIIIRQGETGYCFYIILKGSVSVYAKKEGEGEFHVSQETCVRSYKERLLLFGTEINNLKAGKSFGESVMMEERRDRNATVIADEATMLISIDSELYQRTLLNHNLEWKNKTDFVRKSPFFESWPNAYKSLLIENLRVQKANFGNLVVKQNQACNSVYFIAKGTGKVIVESSVAAKQYKSLKPPKQKGIGSARPETPRDKNEEEEALTVIASRRKRLFFGYVAMERRLRARQIQIAVIGENDVIGDLEMALDLPTFSVSVECLEALECYELDKVNFHRLIVKRNPETLDMIRAMAITKLKYRLDRLAHIPYYQLLVEKAEQEYVKLPAKVIKARPKPIAKALAGFIEGEKKASKKNVIKRLSLAAPGTSGSKDVGVPATEDRKQSVIGQGGTEQKDKERRRGEKKDAKKQYTAEEFRALKKKVQSTGKLIGRVID